MISSYAFYFFVGLLTMYAVSVSYAMVQMWLCIRWMVRDCRPHMFSEPDEMLFQERDQ